MSPAPCKMSPALCKMSPALTGAIVSAVVTVSLYFFGKLWDPISEYLGITTPSDRQRRIDDHKHAVETVAAFRNDLLQSDEHPYSHRVRNWLQRVKDLEADQAKLQAKYDNAGRNWFIKWRCAREATKEQKRADDLTIQYNIVCQEPKRRPRPVECVHVEGSLKMEPYKEKLIHFINSGTSRFLGIWGMCGVGKSALLNVISTSRSKYAASDESFEILLIHAGRNCTVAKLQKAISELLGLAVTNSTETAHAVAISSYLIDKSFLLLLDDMWQPLDLKLVGIPSLPRTQDLRQRIVVASRIKSICSSMYCGQNMIHMLCPSDQIALEIFSDAVGSAFSSDPRIPRLAKRIVEECGHLPAVLHKIGLLMSGKEIEDWENTIELLKESRRHVITHKDEDILDRLKWSYDQLEDSFKPCLLICSLWREGENIPIDKLIRWWIGMGLLDGPNAYMEGSCKVRELQDASLLEKGDNGLCTSERSHLRMHDMVRKMAMRIVNDSEQNWACNSSCRPALTEAKWYKVQRAWASSRDTDVLGRKKNAKSKDQQLTMLVTRHIFNLQPIGLFQSIVFLDMEGSPYKDLPLEVCSMMNLEYLNLSSTRIAALPEEFTNLSKLKYLYIRNNCAFRHIPKGFIAKLENLEEFDIFCTSSLCISSILKDLQDTAADLSMIGFTVTAAELRGLVQLRQVHALSVCLHQFKDQLLDLQLLSEMKKCRELYIVDCPSVKHLVAEGAEVILRRVQSFEIRNLPNLGRVSLNSTWLSMTTLTVSDCGKLNDLTWIRHLDNLEELTVSFCKNMDIVVSAILSGQNAVRLPKVKKIHLQELPLLYTLCDVDLKLDTISHFCIFDWKIDLFASSAA